MDPRFSQITEKRGSLPLAGVQNRGLSLHILIEYGMMITSKNLKWRKNNEKEDP